MASHRFWTLGLLVFTLALQSAACSEGGENIDPGNDAGDDTGGDTGGDTGKDPGEDTGDDGEDDTGEDPVVGDGLVGSSCLGDEDCRSSFCVMLGGDTDGVCSQRCEDDESCIEGWECRGVGSGTGDGVSACVPEGLCVDRDGDGYGIGPGCLGLDCDDTDPTVYHGAAEICDGKDNSCDGQIDNLTIDEGRACSTGLEGVCNTGYTRCLSGTLECIPEILPNSQPEICDGLDNDCDGLVDEHAGVDENDNFVRGLGEACMPDGGHCLNGVNLCDPMRGLYCSDSNDPNDELCDGIDGDCNGIIDDGVPGLHEICTAGEGVCASIGTNVCNVDPTAPVVCSATPNLDNQQPEICNYIDDDCDGVVDGPFVNEQGNYNQVEHCGACNNNCINRWQPTPAAFNVQPSCDASATPASCGYSCINGYVDYDGDEDNGCEFLPDSAAVYVLHSGKGGADSGSCGNWDNPCATITQGISRANTLSRSKVLVSAGTFREGITLQNGISVLGGHSDRNWLRDVEQNRSTIAGTVDRGNHSISVVASNITQSTELSGFTITPPGALASGSSIGVLISSSGNALTIRDNTIRSGTGGTGTAMTPPAPAQSGANGNTGIGMPSASCSASNSNSGGAGNSRMCALPNGGTIDVGGGAGAGAPCPRTSNVSSLTPSPSSSGKPSSTTSGVAAGGVPVPSFTAFGVRDSLCSYVTTANITASIGQDGRNGADGADGSGGSGASNTSFSLDSFGVPVGATGQNGASGFPGSGGSGGGAASGLIYGCNSNRSSCTGNSHIGSTGGAGGSGGCGGPGGDGGHSGGHSIPILVNNAGSGAPSTAPVIQNNNLTRNYAGTGGAGASGGEGGAGGLGGEGGQSETTSACRPDGRRGGDGGNGGNGGGGGGGAGGASFDILFVHASQNAPSNYNSGNTFTVPASAETGGQGGDGGFSPNSPGANGANGAATNIRNLNL